MDTAIVFERDNWQFVRLPRLYWVNSDTVYVRRQGESIVLTPTREGETVRSNSGPFGGRRLEALMGQD